MNQAQVNNALNIGAKQADLSRDSFRRGVISFLEELRKDSKWPWSWLFGLLIGRVKKSSRSPEHF